MTNENIGKLAPRMYVFWAHVKTKIEGKKDRIKCMKIGIVAFTFNGATEKLKNACARCESELMEIESYTVCDFDGEAVTLSN